MGFNLEALLIGLAFILPGFLTSSLVISRTPAVIKHPSAFVETFESLLRSVYINLIVGPISIFIFLKGKPPIEGALEQLLNDGVLAYILARPVQVSFLLFGWLTAALLLATLFGYYWDPLDYLSRRLKSNIGTEANDPWYLLRKDVQSKREQGHDKFQFWVQTRLKNGDAYQGEFSFVSFRDESENRELLLRNVRFLPHSEQQDEGPETPPLYYDAVFIDIENCDSIEVLFTENPYPEAAIEKPQDA